MPLISVRLVLVLSGSATQDRPVNKRQQSRSRRKLIETSDFAIADLSLADGIQWRLLSKNPRIKPVLEFLAEVMRLNLKEEFSTLASSYDIVFQRQLTLNLIEREGGQPVGRFPRLRDGVLTWRIRPPSHRRIMEVEAFRISQVLALQVEGKGGVLLHAALFEKEGQGVLLVGPSGRGKTTASRLLPPPWRSLSDDNALVVHSEQDIYLVHPWPTWSLFNEDGPGGSWEVEHAVPLVGIFFLEQSTTDHVKSLPKLDSLGKLLDSADQATSHILALAGTKKAGTIRRCRFTNLDNLVDAVPQYTLYSRLVGQFWKEMEMVINPGVRNKALRPGR